MPTYQEGGYTVIVDWSDLDRLIGELKGVHERTGELMSRDLEANLKKEAPKGMTGLLQAAWTNLRSGPGEYTITSMVEYSAYVNDGTRPHIAPKEAIMEWAEFRGLPWYPIWRSIAMRGTKANPFVDRAIETTKGRIPVLVHQAIEEMKQI